MRRDSAQKPDMRDRACELNVAPSVHGERSSASLDSASFTDDVLISDAPVIFRSNIHSRVGPNIRSSKRPLRFSLRPVR